MPSTYDVAVQDDRDGTKVATTTAAQENAEHRPAGRFLQFLAKDVPALGYARFNVVEGAPVPVEVSQPGKPVIENEYYRVSLSLLDASISSIIQRDTKRELVNADAILGLNAYVFDRYGSSTKVDHLSGRAVHQATGPHCRTGHRRKCGGRAARDERARRKYDG